MLIAQEGASGISKEGTTFQSQLKTCHSPLDFQLIGFAPLGGPLDCPSGRP